MDNEGMGFDDYEFDWDDGVPDFRPPRFGGDLRNNRYSQAFGDYRGGYGPPGSFLGPPRPPPPFNLGFAPRPLMWGRGFGPGGPPMKRHAHEDKAIKYLMRCGVAKEHLKNLPNELLHLIEPQFCGICGQNFDSFAMSRIHYISKNHLKNQKRWLSKKSEMGPITKKEVPLRARELFCELCDVHITSKASADAHYSGKPHRAIVEGRKGPRNPILLQPNMSARVDQLIRREKKYLKNIIEQQKAESAKEPKPSSSELFCDICKTSVTCTEQMTMHLNGKRHLNKEKQHILMMMRGDTAAAADVDADADAADAAGNNDTTQEDTAGAAAQEEENADNADDKNNTEDDGFDWGNGSGIWDEATPNKDS